MANTKMIQRVYKRDIGSINMVLSLVNQRKENKETGEITAWFTPSQYEELMHDPLFQSLEAELDNIDFELAMEKLEHEGLTV